MCTYAKHISPVRLDVGGCVCVCLGVCKMANKFEWLERFIPHSTHTHGMCGTQPDIDSVAPIHSGMCLPREDVCFWHTFACALCILYETYSWHIHQIQERKFDTWINFKWDIWLWMVMNFYVLFCINARLSWGTSHIPNEMVEMDQRMRMTKT